MIYKSTRERNEDSRDVKAGTVINDKNRNVAIVMKKISRIWEEYIKTILRQRENR